MRGRVQPKKLPIAFRGLRAGIDADPISEPSLDEFGDRFLRRIGPFAGGILRNQPRKLDFRVALRALERSITRLAFAGGQVAADIEFQLPGLLATAANVARHKSAPVPGGFFSLLTRSPRKARARSIVTSA